MGYSISWFAIPAKDPAKLLAVLRLKQTDSPAVPGTTPYAGALLPNGSYVIALNEFQHEWVKPDYLVNLSGFGPVVGCTEGESVNASRAFLYREWNRIWEVSHVLDEGSDHLEVAGKAPRALTALLKTAREEARKEGYDAVFSVPAALAHEVCGFRHDEHHGIAFTTLEPVPAIAGTAVYETLLPQVEAVLLARGFARDGVEAQQTRYVSRAPDADIECTFGYSPMESGGCYLSLPFEVTNHQVRRIAAAAEPDEHPKPTLRTTFHDLTGLVGSVSTAEEIEEWSRQIESRLGEVVDGFHRMKDLDAIINDGAPRYTFMNQPTESHYDLATGHAAIVVAYLAGNPDFDRMVAQTDAGCYGGAKPSNSVHRVVAQLKADARFGEGK